MKALIECLYAKLSIFATENTSINESNVRKKKSSVPSIYKYDYPITNV